jgi:hypothetical protein
MVGVTSTLCFLDCGQSDSSLHFLLEIVMRSITFLMFFFGSHLLVFQLSPSDMLLVFRCELDAIGVIAMDNFRGELHNVRSPWGLGL